MFKLFDSIPYQFFQIFSSTNREMYANILFWIYLDCENENSFSFSKEYFISLIENYFDIHENEQIIEEDGKELKVARDKANWIFRKLKYYGWIDTEFVANGEQIVNFEDYALTFLNAYVNYESENNLELSSYIYRIYRNIENIEMNRSYFTLRDTLLQLNDLTQKLRSLNSNIKKYIKRIAKLNQKNDEEQLEAILDQLLNDYKIKIVDKAYFYMKTNDNPIKYRNKFIDACRKIHYDDFYEMNTVQQIVDEEKVVKEEATLKFNTIMDELEDSFDRIINIIEEIDIKNTKYINVAIERIRILMNHDNNMEGQLLNILKNIQILKEEDLLFSFFNNKNIIPASLYTPKSSIKIKPKPIEIKQHSEETKANKEFLNKLKRNQKFSQKAIRNYVDSLLQQKDRITIEDFNVKDNDDFIRLILIFVYSEEKKNTYKIIWKDKENKIDNVYVPNFIIERKAVK